MICPRIVAILIAEDDVLIRDPLAEYLRGAGYLIVEAANAEEAIAVFAANIPIDVVFSDIQMPGSMDGLGLARWIRRHHPGVRIAITSGAGNAAGAAEVAEVFLVKPYHAAEVAARLGRLLAEPKLPTGSRDPRPFPDLSVTPSLGNPPPPQPRPRWAQRDGQREQHRRPQCSGGDDDPVQR
jgi:CheY-like chemotaxis protein